MTPLEPTTIDRSEERRLAQRVAEGDREAFALLYDRYNAALFGVVMRIMRDEAASADALQEAFVKIWRKMGTWNPDRGTLFTWMLNVARNTAIDKVRQIGRRREIRDVDPDVALSMNMGSTELSIAGIGIRERVQQMDANLREVIELAYFDGYTQTEIAEALELPLGTVKTRTRKALSELRKLFN